MCCWHKPRIFMNVNTRVCSIFGPPCVQQYVFTRILVCLCYHAYGQTVFYQFLIDNKWVFRFGHLSFSYLIFCCCCCCFFPHPVSLIYESRVCRCAVFGGSVVMWGADNIWATKERGGEWARERESERGSESERERERALWRRTQLRNSHHK